MTCEWCGCTGCYGADNVRAGAKLEKTMNMRTEQAYDEKKLAELIVYIAAKCQRHARFGATKLNKILYYSDFMSFESRGKAITGAVYRKLPYGPAPATLKPVEAALIGEGAVAMQKSLAFAGAHYTEKRLLALRDADLSLFEAEDIAVVDAVIDLFKDVTAADVSELSHRHAGWKMARDMEEIPYFTVYLPDEVGSLSARDAEWVQSVVKRVAV